MTVYDFEVCFPVDPSFKNVHDAWKVMTVDGGSDGVGNAVAAATDDNDEEDEEDGDDGEEGEAVNRKATGWADAMTMPLAFQTRACHRRWWTSRTLTSRPTATTRST